MAVRILSLVWDGYPGGGTELLALLALANWADDDGRCWPSIASISKKTRLSRSQAQRVVHRLIESGYVSVTGNETGGPPGSTRQYLINLDMLTGCMDATPTGRTDATGTGSAHATGSTDATGRMDAADGSHLATETGSTHATQTVSEPSTTVNAREQARSSPAISKSKKPETTLAKFLEACKSGNEKPIPADDPVYAYIEKVGISDEMVSVAWKEFKSYWLAGEGRQKRKRDWRLTFLNAIKQNRSRLWFITEGETARWTTQGEQARRAAA